MILRQRDYSLNYSRAIKHDKVLLVLEWLLEFRFSTLELMAELLDSNTTNLHRFFAKLLSDGVIRRFSNVHTRGYRYVMLTPIGVAYLEAEGFDISQAATRVQNLGRYAQIMHDIAVQHAVMLRRDDFERVVWDRHIDTIPKDNVLPDALLWKSNSETAIALEYERWRKDDKRIYLAFRSHLHGIEGNYYRGVQYLFDKQTDLDHYKRLLYRDEWPEVTRTSGTGKVSIVRAQVPISDLLRHEDYRARFGFKFEPISTVNSTHA